MHADKNKGLLMDFNPSLIFIQEIREVMEIKYPNQKLPADYAGSFLRYAIMHDD